MTNYIEILPNELQYQNVRDVKVQELENKIKMLEKKIEDLHKHPVQIFFTKPEMEDALECEITNEKYQDISYDFDEHCQHFFEFITRI